mgnify:CR=1 FL=1
MPDLRDRWEQMSPRERDAMVAEKVMGYRQLPVNWFPGTDITAALDVVEKMREKGFMFMLIQDCHGIYAAFEPKPTMEGQCQTPIELWNEVDGDSFADVIALASLLALGVE